MSTDFPSAHVLFQLQLDVSPSPIVNSVNILPSVPCHLDPPLSPCDPGPSLLVVFMKVTDDGAARRGERLAGGASRCAAGAEAGAAGAPAATRRSWTHSADSLPGPSGDSHRSHGHEPEVRKLGKSEKHDRSTGRWFSDVLMFGVFVGVCFDLSLNSFCVSGHSRFGSNVGTSIQLTTDERKAGTCGRVSWLSVLGRESPVMSLLLHTGRETHKTWRSAPWGLPSVTMNFLDRATAWRLQHGAARTT